MKKARNALVAVLLFFRACHCAQEDAWLYNNPICTGLGDRLGMLLSLSALARLDSTVVYMEWCTDPTRAVISNPLFMQYIPQWSGYDFPLETLETHFYLPHNVHLYTSWSAPPSLPHERLVQWGMPDQLPAFSAIPLTSTMYGRALRLGNDASRQRTNAEYLQAYREAGKEMRTVNHDNDLPYVLIHFRASDHNTDQRNEIPFCTRQVLRRLHDSGIYMKVISNNHSFALQWMKGLPSVHMVHSHSVFEDIGLALNAAAIVQHASTGWSSYTSVPAMAKEIPLINTYTGSNHRYDVFAQYEGGLPEEFFSCTQVEVFVKRVASFLTGNGFQQRGKGFY